MVNSNLKKILIHILGVDFRYPVGSYYETSDTSFNPNDAWGGTWYLETGGQVHVSAGGTDYEVNSTNTDTVNADDTVGVSQNGSSTVTLTEAQLPSVSGHFSIRRWNTGGAGSMVGYIGGKVTLTQKVTGTGSYAAASAGSSGSIPLMDRVTYSFGSGQAHNNMQPYIVVNRWHRVA